ncbi:toll/interleukin-1 receptor domain-containing protein [Adlercreutzia sp.]|uniref:toll/interleukin-1 receptor domain-containing protein n=1 Tax=Adlercreutzia sp. TaxID=1872387 RepID=UPI003AB468A1
MQNATTYTNPSDYAAFISYRHLPRDAEVACEVQRAIEEYRLPQHVARAKAPAETTSHTNGMSTETAASNNDAHSRQKRRPGRPTKLGKCFRDEDELAASHSLPDSIREALAASRTLIVICSPETQESPWVRREIEMFEQLHGRERIICVLAAGSPEESIPPIPKTRMTPDANGILREMPAEPLAADLRPEAKAKRKAELLRIIAAVAGCSYDDLRQRERARKRKHIALTSAAAALAIVVIGIFAFQFHQTSEAALIAESKSLAAQALDQYANGEHLQAIETALPALPSSESDTSRPLVPEAQAALEKVLALNPDPDQPWTPFYLFESDEEIVDVAYSQEGAWIATLDAAGAVSLHDANSGASSGTATPDIFVLESDTVPATDWFIEGMSPSCLIMGNRTGQGGVMGVNPLTGKSLWKMHSVYPLAAAPPDKDADSQNFGLLAYGTHSIAASLIGESSGELLAGSEMPVDQFPRSANFDTFCIQEKPARAYCALNTALVTFDLADGTSRQDTVSDATIQSVRCKDDLVAFTAANIENSSNGTNNHPFSITVARNTGDGFETLWTYEDTFAVTVSAKADALEPFANIPKIIDVLHCEEDLVLASAGKKLYIFSLATGEVVYEQEFSVSIVAAQPCFVEEGRYAISLGLSDGTLNVISPLFDATASTDSSTTAVPFALNGAWLGADNYGNPVAYLYTADRPNRIYCYLLRPFYDDTVVEELTLDELLAYARQAVGQS